MLAIPESGFNRSIDRHNITLELMCDWIECSVLFDDDTLSQPEIIDVLCDNHYYDDKTFASFFLSNVWAELRRRNSWLGAGSPMRIGTRSIQRIVDWDKTPAHAFCLSLSLARYYPTWAASFGRNYTVQGSLFEELTAASLKAMFTEWEIYTTGWTTTNPNKLNDVVKEVATRVHEPVGRVSRWTKAQANEAGLDILCYRTYGDRRAGIPVYLVQCASGGHYEDKLRTPDLRIWGRIVEFTADPKKAFSMPFGLTDDEFIRVCNIVDGLLLDRYRLLAPGRTSKTWLQKPLQRSMISWIKPRLKTLPKYV